MYSIEVQREGQTLLITTRPQTLRDAINEAKRLVVDSEADHVQVVSLVSGTVKWSRRRDPSAPWPFETPQSG